MTRKLTPAQREHLKLKIGRAMEENPVFAQRVLERDKKKNSTP